MNINISFIIYINYNVEQQEYGVRFKNIVNKKNVYLKVGMYIFFYSEIIIFKSFICQSEMSSLSDLFKNILKHFILLFTFCKN